jgi:hypothetical protein
MTPKALEDTAVMRQIGNELVVSMADIDDVHLTQDQLKENKYTIHLDQNIAVEVVGFNPEDNSIVIHKVKKETPAAPVVEPQLTDDQKDNWKKKLITLIPLIPAAVIGGTLTIGTIMDPPKFVESSPPGYHEPAPEIIETPQLIYETDESLKCPATKEVLTQDGDYLTKMLVDINGEGRYVLPDGGMNVDLLYKDLMCLLAIPENINELKNESADPLVAKYVENRMSTDNQIRFGPATATTLYRGLLELNSPDGKDRYPNADKQLVKIQPGQKFKIPDFSMKP